MDVAAVQELFLTLTLHAALVRCDCRVAVVDVLWIPKHDVTARIEVEFKNGPQQRRDLGEVTADCFGRAIIHPP